MMQSKKKLLVFCNDYLGGVANLHKSFCNSQAFKSFEIKVVFIHLIGSSLTRLKQHFDIENEVILELDFTKKNLYERSKEIITEINSFKPDIVLSNFDEELKAIHLYSVELDFKVFYLCHDELYVERAIIYQFQIDKYICHNPIFYDELIIKLPHRKDDIFYIPYGINVPDKMVIKDYNADKLNLVWLARLHKLKGIYDLLKIEENLQSLNFNVNWTVIGDGPERENFQSMVKDKVNFTLLSPVSNKDVIDLLIKQHVFVLPSQLDGLPVSLLETMSMGITPIMYKFNEGISRIISENEGKVVEKGNYLDIVKEVIFLSEHRNILKEKSEASFNKVKLEFNIELQAKKYFEVYLNSEKSNRKSKRPSILKMYKFYNHKFMPGFLYRLIRKAV